jgi:uncharacterized sulfatase
MAIDHNAYPQPGDQGFDWTRSDRGATAPQRPHRLTDFATRTPDDPYRLDEKGFPFHQNSEDALTFLREQTRSISSGQADSGQDAKPFFLYYATWLVHAPIHTRSKPLLDKYVKKLGVEYPTDPAKWEVEGQNNPYYCAMVEMLDYYAGKIFDYLDNTEDPRWPGHKLAENTYIIFTSDNGGMEGHPGEIITDNYPLDKGKISAMEGGTRVPLIITGPGIKAGVHSDVMVNGLDFYPTILSLVGAEPPAGKHFDGCDLSTLLLKDATNAAFVKGADGSVRDTMVWHFPHSVAMESTIRIGDYKLVRNYDHVSNPGTPELELYRLYQTENGKQGRADIEESKNLAASMPEKAMAMNQRLTDILTEMKASYPYYNPHYRGDLPGKDTVPVVLSHALKGLRAEFTYRENGAKVVRADLIYTLNGGQRYEEWFRTPAQLLPGAKVAVELPAGTTHYFINLIDENNFIVSYPEVMDGVELNKTKAKFSKTALAVKE